MYVSLSLHQILRYSYTAIRQLSPYPLDGLMRIWGGLHIPKDRIPGGMPGRSPITMEKLVRSCRATSLRQAPVCYSLCLALML